MNFIISIHTEKTSDVSVNYTLPYIFSIITSYMEAHI